MLIHVYRCRRNEAARWVMALKVVKFLEHHLGAQGCVYFAKELDFERVPSAISRHIIVLNVGFFSRDIRYVGLETITTAGPSQRSTVQSVEPYVAHVYGEYARFRQQLGVCS